MQYAKWVHFRKIFIELFIGNLNFQKWDTLRNEMKWCDEIDFHHSQILFKLFRLINNIHLRNSNFLVNLCTIQKFIYYVILLCRLLLSNWVWKRLTNTWSSLSTIEFNTFGMLLFLWYVYDVGPRPARRI